jgi:aminoglycoside phosphotransferase (APT) family kinase protein
VRSFTKTPVPKVLDWSDDDSSIGTEYIIMEHVAGVQLHEKWSSMSPHQHMLCVKNVSLMMAEMVKLPFTMYGSLYFADAPIEQSLKSGFVEGFCIGPHCGPQY